VARYAPGVFPPSHKLNPTRRSTSWVVLSACNTAAGEKADAEALSGLARAFFYAKARALLVSHWYVDSNAAVKLTTRTFAELSADRRIGRAEALRRSMARMITQARRKRHTRPPGRRSYWSARAPGRHIWRQTDFRKWHSFTVRAKGRIVRYSGRIYLATAAATGRGAVSN
jgi:CHAT domain-containing protein